MKDTSQEQFHCNIEILSIVSWKFLANYFLRYHAIDKRHKNRKWESERESKRHTRDGKDSQSFVICEEDRLVNEPFLEFTS